MNNLNNEMFTWFEVDDETYLYDARSNYFCEIEKDSLEILINNNFRLKELEFNNLQNKGIFYSGSLEKVTADRSEINKFIDYYMDHVLPRKLILEVTEECNLRCKYCFNTIGNTSRVHSKQKLSLENAQKGIDLYFNIYTECFKKIPKHKQKQYLKIAPPNISWWGGEPLLNFDLICETQKYFLSLPWSDYGISDRFIVYSIATNLTYLPKNIISFLVENNVYLFVSLDGGLKEHNLYRIKENGKGSFEDVKKNLDSLLFNYPNYSKKHIIIQAVYMEGHSLLESENSYFKSYLYENGECKVLKINQYPQKTENTFISQQWINMLPSMEQRIERFKKELELLGNTSDDILSNLKKSPSLFDEIQEVISLEKQLIFENPNGSNTFSEFFSCPIGRDVIYLSAKGEYQICNKADSSYKIGDSISGISKQEIGEMLDIYLHTLESKCKSCWAFQFCSICPANLMNNGKFCKPSEMECKYLRDVVKWKFYKLIILIKMDTLYDKIKNIISDINDNSFLDYSHSIFIKY